ncbi:hypothetical protein MNBD_GAMMA10-3305, partial [hydrothermal vent metagenome]
MTTQKTLNISIKPSALQDFCQKQLTQSQDIGITHN